MQSDIQSKWILIYYPLETTMEFKLNDVTLTATLPVAVSSQNAEDLRKEFIEAIEKYHPAKVIIDCHDVSYISSAGLRVFLFLKQEVGEVEVIDTSLEVYNIFQMTGFTKLLTIHRKLEEIDVTGKQIIGEGRTGVVYRLDKDTIVKVYKRDISISSIEQEMNLSRESFVLGIPTAITFDIVKVDGHLASRFEMLDCLTLAEVIKGDLSHLDKYLDEYASLLKKINSSSSSNLQLSSKKKKYQEHASYCLSYLDKEDGEKLVRLIDEIPEAETFIHGDCHIKNIMSDGKSLFLIDMGSLSKGYPLFDLAALYRTFFGFDFIEPGNTESFFELDRDTLDKIFYGVMERYFDGKFNQEVLDKIALTGLVYLISWNHRYEGGKGARSQDAVARLIPLIKRVENLFLPL